MSQLDETVPGGLYLDAQGIYRDAWGNKVEVLTKKPQPLSPEDDQEIKKPTEDKKKKSKEVTNE
jgi:hypothetical protein